MWEAGVVVVASRDELNRCHGAGVSEGFRVLSRRGGHGRGEGAAGGGDIWETG